MELKDILSKERYEHSVRTREMAKKLCNIHNIDKKAVIASYYHDCAKELSLDEMKSLIKDTYKEDIDNMYTKNILHGFAGAVYVKNFGIEDIDIENAIRYHTIGRLNMTDIEKVVYLSDAIEEGRDFEGVKEIREQAYIDLDKAILLELDYKIKSLIDRGLIIHKNAILLRNSLLEGLK